MQGLRKARMGRLLPLQLLAWGQPGRAAHHLLPDPTSRTGQQQHQGLPSRMISSLLEVCNCWEWGQVQPGQRPSQMARRPFIQVLFVALSTATLIFHGPPFDQAWVLQASRDPLIVEAPLFAAVK